jgi:hypothetical protein
MSTYLERVKRTSLAGVLRLLGALIVVAGLCAHLLEGWAQWGDLSRFYVLLGVTGALSVAGFVISTWCKEQKGARIFVGLGLIAVVASLTTLGGLLDEILSWQGFSASSLWLINPGALAAYSPGQVASMLILALVTLIPVTQIAYRVLARPKAKQLTLLFAFTSLLICVPVRDSWPLGLTILLSVCVPAGFIFRHAREHIVFATGEGRFALLSLFFPALVMLARLLWLYEADTLLTWILLATTFAGVHLFRQQTVPGAAPCAWLGFTGLVVALALSLASLTLLEGLLQSSLLLPVGGAFIALAVLWLGLPHERARAGLDVMASLCLAIAVLINLIVDDTLLAVAAGVLSGLLIWVGGRWRNNLPVRVIGAVIVVAALLPRVLQFGQYIDFTHWLTLGVLGVSLLAGAVLLEKRQGKPAASQAAIVR